MFAQKELDDLAEKRRLLVLEADLHRNLIVLESEGLRAKFAWIDQVRERVAAGGPWLAAGGTVAGLFAMRHWRKLARWAPVALTAMKWLKSFKGR